MMSKVKHTGILGGHSTLSIFLITNRHLPRKTTYHIYTTHKETIVVPSIMNYNYNSK